MSTPVPPKTHKITIKYDSTTSTYYLDPSTSLKFGDLLEIRADDETQGYDLQVNISAGVVIAGSVNVHS